LEATYHPFSSVKVTMNRNKSPKESSNTVPELIDPTAYKIDVIIPAYNEERFIGSIVLKLVQNPLTVIVVDDGSTDDTALVARLAGATVIRHETNLGKGQALNTGFRAACQLAPDAIVTMDADGQHNPDQLFQIVQPVLEGKADIVIGTRHINSANQIPRLRLWGHRFFNLLIRSLSGTPSTDSQSGYRAFSPKAFQADIFHRSDFSVESEMQFLAHEYDLQVIEIPIEVRYYDKPKRSVWVQGLIVLGGLIRLVGQYRPLLFFGIPGLTLLMGGILLGLRVVDRFNHFKQLATGTALISVTFAILGLTLLSTGVILHSVRGLIKEILRSRLAEER
jgi:glycosyltransferase involved in cell wall biosynthesis